MGKKKYLIRRRDNDAKVISVDITGYAETETEDLARRLAEIFDPSEFTFFIETYFVDEED